MIDLETVRLADPEVAEAMGLEEEEEGKFEKWLKKRLGKSRNLTIPLILYLNELYKIESFMKP